MTFHGLGMDIFWSPTRNCHLDIEIECKLWKWRWGKLNILSIHNFGLGGDTVVIWCMQGPYNNITFPSNIPFQSTCITKWHKGDEFN